MSSMHSSEGRAWAFGRGVCWLVLQMALQGAWPAAAAGSEVCFPWCLSLEAAFCRMAGGPAAAYKLAVHKHTHIACMRLQAACGMPLAANKGQWMLKIPAFADTERSCWENLLLVCLGGLVVALQADPKVWTALHLLGSSALVQLRSS